ncbi:MAG: hypothetical protein HXY20_15130 [Acidobacteria bacterium]|nr:hypothetical protein [Acidobacteriota bacterium]
MRKTRLVVILMLAALATGCGPLASLYPLWDSDHVVAEPKLIGTWISEDDEVLKLAAAGELKYVVTYASSEGVSRYETRVVHLDGQLYLDMCPDEESLEVLLAAQAYLPLVPTHFFARVSVQGESLNIALLDEEIVEEMVDHGEVDLPLLRHEGGLLLAAETGRIQELLVTFADDEQFWEEGTQFRRQRSPQ